MHDRVNRHGDGWWARRLEATIRTEGVFSGSQEGLLQEAARAEHGWMASER